MGHSIIALLFNKGFSRKVTARGTDIVVEITTCLELTIAKCIIFIHNGNKLTTAMVLHVTKILK